MSILSVAIFYSALCLSGGNYLSPAYTDDSVHLTERVYIHTDRDIYSPGEDIWFKAYLVDGLDLLLTDHSNNLHVEIISPDLKIITSIIIRMDNGLGKGDFTLPPGLKTGSYTLRAYTNYMRNFSDEIFFSKEIIMVNPEDTKVKTAESSEKRENKIDISFFPEGGSLTDNIPCVVGFKAVDAYGKGFDVSGEVWSSSGDLETRFISTYRGTGNFLITPKPGCSYYVIAKSFNGTETRGELPKSFARGININIPWKREDEIIVIIRTNTETLSEFNNQDLTLTVRSNNRIFKTITFGMEESNSLLYIPTSDLPEGILVLTLYDPAGRPVSERLIYNCFPQDPVIRLETDKPGYTLRDSVSLRITMKGPDGMKPDAWISLSASEELYSVNSISASSISSWFLLESGIKGPVENPAHYFDLSNPSRLKDLDILLLTQGWRDFEWKYDKMIYPPENGFTVSGSLRKKFVNSTFEEARINIGLFSGKIFRVAAIDIDTSGRFRLDSINFTGQARLIVSASGKKGRLQGWLFLDSVSAIPPAVMPFRDFYSSTLRPTETRLNTGERMMVSYIQRQESINLDSLIADALSRRNILKKYNLKDTIALPDINVIANRNNEYQEAQEKNYAQARGMPIGGGAHNVRNLNVPNEVSGPLLIIDGARGADYFPASLIESVVSLSGGDAAVWGIAGINGVISIISKKDWGSTHTPYLHSVKTNITGYYEPRIFYSPKHTTTLQSDFKPDLRKTIFWKPDIKLSGSDPVVLTFYNSDRPSQIRVTAEGITSSGVPVTCVMKYEVK